MGKHDEITKVTCPVCNGEGMIVKEEPGKYSGKTCWLCRGGKVIHPNVYARWIKIGRPKEMPS